MGAAIGFLWFNAHPAQVFMGDTGSLAIGGALGTVAILLKAEFLLLLIGGVFAAEARQRDPADRRVTSGSSARAAGSTPTPTGSSAWRRCTTTSRSWAGPRPRW